MSAVASSGRVRAHPALPLGYRLTTAPPGIVVDPPKPLPRRTAAEVVTWFADPVPMPFVAATLRTMAPSDAIQALLHGPNPVRLSAVYREREGGRRYAYALPGDPAFRLLTERAHDRLGPRLLLQSIPRVARSAFPAPRGQRFVLVDLRHCFLVLLATVAGDRALLGAIEGDLHQQAGDAMVPHLGAGERREMGKRFNSAVVGLVTAEGWYADLRRRGVAVTRDQAHAMHAGWWARFPAARALVDRWIATHREAAHTGQSLRITYPDGRQYTYDVATVRGAAPRPGWAHLVVPADRLAASIRTSFSAIWRGVEATILDEALARVDALRPLGLRLVLPMYDGLLLVAPTPAADELAFMVESAVMGAMRAVGVFGHATVGVASTWGESPSPTRCPM